MSIICVLDVRKWVSILNIAFLWVLALVVAFVSGFMCLSQCSKSAVICSGALLFSSRVLRPSLVTLCSHTSGRCAVELYHASLLWYPPLYTSPMASSALQHWTASPTKKAATDKLVEKIVKHDSWPIQPDILSPPLLRLISRKQLWLDLQPVDIKSRWRHNWKLAQVVNSHLVCDPTIW